ncbi:MAG: sister chromatid cohesion protein PDS5, partial [Bacteroidota bacterium]
MSIDEQYGVSQAILKEAKSGNHKLLITSRPYGVETERSLVDIEIKHVGFDIIQRDWFVHRVLAGANQNTPGKLLSFIKDHHLEEMSQVPVNLRILSALWKTRGDEITQYNPGLPGLYRELVNHVWEQFATRGAFRRAYTRSEKESLFEDLEKVALESLQRGEIIIRRSTCEEVLGNTPSPLLKDSDFLLFQKIDHQYQFPHLTFQEYFAGRYLARKFLLGQQDEVAAFLRAHMYVPRYQRTLSFMAGEMSKGMPQELGLVSPKERIAPMRDLLRLLSSVPRDILGVRHLLLELRLLDEWLLVSSQSWVSESLANLEREFSLGQRLITWFNKALRQYRRYDKSTQILYTTLMTLLSEANGVTKHYGTELRKHILNALQDSDYDVRNAALAALQTLLEKGVEVQEMVPPMLNALQDRDRCLREFAIEVLGTLLEKGAEVQEMLPLILNALQDRHADVRETALKALRALLEKGVEVQGMLPPILNALQDGDFPVREAALKALRTLLEKGAEVQGTITPILNVLQDRHADVRRAALEALGTLLEQGAEVQGMVPLILNALQHDNADVRRVALTALGTLLEQGAEVQEMITPMLNALQDKHSDVRIAALEALQTLLGQGAEVQGMITPMLNVLQDSHADVRWAVLEALGTLLEQGAEVQGILPPILSALQDSHADVRESALAALRTLLEKGAGVQEMIPPILNALQDRYADVRRAALAALQALLEQGAEVQGMLPPILNALQDRYADVRESALATLGTLLEHGAEVQEILLPILNALQHGNADVRRVVYGALRGQPVAEPRPDDMAAVHAALDDD